MLSPIIYTVYTCILHRWLHTWQPLSMYHKTSTTSWPLYQEGSLAEWYTYSECFRALAVNKGRAFHVTCAVWIVNISIKCPTSIGQMYDQEAAVQWTLLIWKWNHAPWKPSILYGAKSWDLYFLKIVKYFTELFLCTIDWPAVLQNCSLPNALLTTCPQQMKSLWSLVAALQLHIFFSQTQAPLQRRKGGSDEYTIFILPYLFK